MNGTNLSELPVQQRTNVPAPRLEPEVQRALDQRAQPRLAPPTTNVPAGTYQQALDVARQQTRPSFLSRAISAIPAALGAIRVAAGPIAVASYVFGSTTLAPGTLPPEQRPVQSGGTYTPPQQFSPLPAENPITEPPPAPAAPPAPPRPAEPAAPPAAPPPPIVVPPPPAPTPLPPVIAPPQPAPPIPTPQRPAEPPAPEAPPQPPPPIVVPPPPAPPKPAEPATPPVPTGPVVPKPGFRPSTPVPAQPIVKPTQPAPAPGPAPVTTPIPTPTPAPGPAPVTTPIPTPTPAPQTGAETTVVPVPVPIPRPGQGTRPPARPPAASTQAPPMPPPIPGGGQQNMQMGQVEINPDVPALLPAPKPPTIYPHIGIGQNKFVRIIEAQKNIQSINQQKQSDSLELRQTHQKELVAAQSQQQAIGSIGYQVGGAAPSINSGPSYQFRRGNPPATTPSPALGGT